MSEPTQCRHPWRATIRTTVAAILATAIAASPHIGAIDWSDRSTVGLTIAATALVTRLMADPRIEAIFTRYLGGMLAANPTRSRRQDNPDATPALHIIDRVNGRRHADD